MIMSVRVCGLCLLLALGACAQPTTGDHTAPGMHAAKPPADYVFIGSAEGTGTKDVQVGVNTDLLSETAAEGSLTALFGIYFAGAVRDAKPAHPAATGDGSSVENPVVFDPALPGKTVLHTAMNDLAGRFPDRHDVKGYLFRSPAQEYRLYVVFETGRDSNALYYDVTAWADYIKKAY
jgi:hypothetical protein